MLKSGLGFRTSWCFWKSQPFNIHFSWVTCCYLIPSLEGDTLPLNCPCSGSSLRGSTPRVLATLLYSLRLFFSLCFLYSRMTILWLDLYCSPSFSFSFWTFFWLPRLRDTPQGRNVMFYEPLLAAFPPCNMFLFVHTWTLPFFSCFMFSSARVHYGGPSRLRLGHHEQPPLDAEPLLGAGAAAASGPPPGPGTGLRCADGPSHTRSPLVGGRGTAPSS